MQEQTSQRGGIRRRTVLAAALTAGAAAAVGSTTLPDASALPLPAGNGPGIDWFAQPPRSVRPQVSLVVA